MSKGLSIQQAHTFFGGHFRTAPLGVVDQDGKFRVVHNLSATDPDGFSTNSWLDASENATKYYSAAQFADAVSSFPQLHYCKSPEPAVASLVVDILLFHLGHACCFRLRLICHAPEPCFRISFAVVTVDLSCTRTMLLHLVRGCFFFGLQCQRPSRACCIRLWLLFYICIKSSHSFS